MTRLVIFGNSGSGKSTLAKHLASKYDIAHLDLDTVAWQATHLPERMPVSESNKSINHFLSENMSWVVEGCYADLLALVIQNADEVILLNLPTSACIANAKNRPWEPHKYESKAAQDKNLAMLINWISQYDSRADTFSKAAHEKLYDNFCGKKTKCNSNKQY